MALAKRRKATKALCIFNPSCWQEAVVCGMCGACYSWWRNFSFKTASEVTTYIKRVNRYHGRITGNIPQRPHRKGRPVDLKARFKLIKG